MIFLKFIVVKPIKSSLKHIEIFGLYRFSGKKQLTLLDPAGCLYTLLKSRQSISNLRMAARSVPIRKSLLP